jgi:hypothetical protein
MITRDQARALHLQLLHAASDEVVSAVLQLHVPGGSTLGGSWPTCSGCVGSIQGDGIIWPDDCDTTQVIAPFLHVDLPR